MKIGSKKSIDNITALTPWRRFLFSCFLALFALSSSFVGLLLFGPLVSGRGWRRAVLGFRAWTLPLFFLYLLAVGRVCKLFRVFHAFQQLFFFSKVVDQMKGANSIDLRPECGRPLLGLEGGVNS